MVIVVETDLGGASRRGVVSAGCPERFSRSGDLTPLGRSCQLRALSGGHDGLLS